MAEEPQVKGVAFRSLFASLAKLRGVSTQQAALSAFGEELRSGFAYGGIVPGGWVPHCFVSGAAGRRAQRGRQLIYDLGRQCTKDDMAAHWS